MYRKYGFMILCFIGVLAVALSSCSKEEKGLAPPPAVSPAASNTAAPEINAPTAASSAPTAATGTPPPTAAKVPDVYAGEILSEAPVDVKWWQGSENKPYCGTGNTIGMQFYATTTFHGVGFRSPTWTATGGYFVDYKLYAWKDGYDETLIEEPVATAHLEDWPDGECAQMMFDPLPDGEYLLIALYGSTVPNCNAGIWYFEEEYPGTRAYLNDEIWYDVSIMSNILYTKTPANIYGPLSDSGLE